MAHALYGHNGPCKNIHGHTYTLSVTLLGKIQNIPGTSEDGMVVDFSIIKDLVRKHIVDVYDHALVLNGNSPHKELEGIKTHSEKLILINEQPTCENLALRFAEHLQTLLPKNLLLHHLRLQETPSSWAEWHREDNC